MTEHASGSVGNVLLAFLAGAAVGGLVVALTTPKSGEELRADMKGLGNRMKERAEGAMEAMGSTFREAGQEAGDAVSQAKTELKEAAQDMRG